MSIIEEYTITTTNKKITLKDKKGGKSTLLLENPNQIEIKIISVDEGNLIKGIRCDYLIIPGDLYECFIELKGKDISHALKQILATVKQLSSFPRDANKLAFIITTRPGQIPKMSSTIQNVKRQLRKDYNVTLEIKRTGYTHTISNQ